MSGFSISIKKSRSNPIPAGHLEVTEVSQALVIRAPGQANGLVWNRPYAVRVQVPGEKMQVVPVYDYTRRAQLLILGAACGHADEGTVS